MFNMVDVASKKDLLELIRTDAQTLISQSFPPLSEHGVTRAYNNDDEIILRVNNVKKENEIFEPMQTIGYSHIFPSTSHHSSRT